MSKDFQQPNHAPESKELRKDLNVATRIKKGIISGGKDFGLSVGYFAMDKILKPGEESPLLFSPVEKWKHEGKPLLSFYDLPDSRPFELYVDELETWAAKRNITQEELDEAMSEEIDPEEVYKNLPEGMTQEQFLGTVELAMLTECATDSYAEKFINSGNKYDQRWLGRFTEKIWVPDEYQHANPFKILLMKMGIPEEELDKKIKVAQEANYSYGDDHSPVAVTMFGVLQEYLTDHYHGLIANAIKPSAPKLSKLINRVKQRETLHTEWYRDMTAMQIGQNPELILSLTAAVEDFHLPGNEVAPHLQDRAEEFLVALRADFGRVKRDIVRLIYESTNNTQNLGKFVLEIGAQKEKTFGKYTSQEIQRALSKHGKIGAAAESLIGEMLLEASGLEVLARHNDKGPVGQIRSLIRTQGANVLKGDIEKIFKAA